MELAQLTCHTALSLATRLCTTALPVVEKARPAGGGGQHVCACSAVIGRCDKRFQLQWYSGAIAAEAVMTKPHSNSSQCYLRCVMNTFTICLPAQMAQR